MSAGPKFRLKLLPTQADLPPGPTWRCTACGARVRLGSPHGGVKPFPHNTVDALMVREERKRAR